MNKQEYILELINKGYSDDEIELLVKDKFPEEEIIPFMPAAPEDTQIISSSDYTKIGFASSALSYAIGFISTKELSKPDETKPLILEFNNIIDGRNDLPIIPNTGKILIEFFGVYDDLSGFSERKWYASYNTATKNKITFLKGHLYQFENGKDPVDLGASLPTTGAQLTPQEAFDQTWDIIKTVGDKASRHGVTNITDLTTGDAIYNYVEQGKIYFMAVDHNKQYLMQGLCINKDSSQATFVGYSWNTSVKHTNTVWAQARKGSTSGDSLSFNGVSVDELKNDDNALANVALVKALVAAGGSSGGSVDTTNLALKDLSNVDNTILRKKVESLSAYGIVTTSDCKTEVELYNKLNSLGGGESKSIRILLHIDEDWKYTITNDDGTTNDLTLYSNFYIAEFYTQTQDSTYRSVSLTCKFLDSINDRIHFSVYGPGDSNGSTNPTEPKYRYFYDNEGSEKILNNAFYRLYPENENDTFLWISSTAYSSKIGETFIISLYKDTGDATPEQEIKRKTFGILTINKFDNELINGSDTITKYYLFGKLISDDGSIKNITATVSSGSTNEDNFTYVDEPTFTVSDIDSWTPNIINKIKEKLGLATNPTQTLQEYIDTLDWTNVTLSIQDGAVLITPDMFVGLPNLDSDITTTISDHENISGSGQYDFVLSFSSQGETAEKTVRVNVTIGSAPNELAQTIEGLTWTGITYTTDATVAEDSLGMFDLINAPQIPDDVTIDSITHSSISASGDLTVSIHFSKGSQTYIKDIIVAVTINSGTQTLQEYIDSLNWSGLTYKNKGVIAIDSMQYALIENTPPLKAGVVNDGTIENVGISSDGDYTITISFRSQNERATKQVSVSVKILEETPTKTITITSSQYTAIDESYKETYGYALTGYTLTDTITQFAKLILDVRENLTIPKSTKFYDDGYSNTIFVLNSIQSDTFDLVAGHKYSFEDTKDPVDLGTYDTSGGGSGGGGTTPGATLQDAIDALTWTGITAHLPSGGTLSSNQLTYNDLVGAPTLPSGTSIQSISHNSMYDAGDLSVIINFTKGEDWATKTINVNIVIATYVPKTYTFDSSNYSTITYSKRFEDSESNNKITFNNSTSTYDILPDDTIILYCDTSGSVEAETFMPTIHIQYKQELTAEYEYNLPKGATSRNYNFVAGHKYQIRSGYEIVDLGTFDTGSSSQDSTPIVKASEYTSIENSFSNDTHTFIGINSQAWNSFDFGSFYDLSSAIIIEIKTATTLTAGLNKFKSSSTVGFSYNLDNSVNLLAGHKYKFEPGVAPLDLGTY